MTIYDNIYNSTIIIFIFLKEIYLDIYLPIFLFYENENAF